MRNYFSQHKGVITQILFWGFLFALFYSLGIYIPEGFDWENYYSIGKTHPIWTPWLAAIPFDKLNWPFVVGITLTCLVYRTYHYNKTYLPVIFSILSLPTLWVLFMGNIDGLVLFGLILLPWGAPLALLKPQLAGFALLARKSSVICGIIWILFSFVIWGFWPMRFLLVLQSEWRAEWTQDISLFPWGLIIAIPLLRLSRGDEDLLMASGSFATPHLFPYHFILLTPSFGRMNLKWMILTWIISWTPLCANWIGDIGWHMGNLLGLCFWLGIYFSKKKKINED